MSRIRLEEAVTHAAAALVVLGAAACATHHAGTVELYEAPRLLWSPPLAYPESLMLAQVEGSVVLQAQIDTNGRVDRTSVRVVRSTNPGFEAAAIEMLCGARFRPAQLGDSPTADVVEVPVLFELEDSVVDSVAAVKAAAEGTRLARAGAIPRAMAAFSEAQRLDTRFSSSPAIWRTLCWYGSVWGYAEDVVGTCDRLVVLVPDELSARDARGIARALTGDIQGAIVDFEAVAAASNSERQRAERAEWLRTLRAGRNPVTPDVLERLRSRAP